MSELEQARRFGMLQSWTAMFYVAAYLAVTIAGTGPLSIALAVGGLITSLIAFLTLATGGAE